MNGALSLPILAVAARKSQIGGNADPEFTHGAPSANGGFSFQMDLAGGE
jgi:hypothetical protein